MQIMYTRIIAFEFLTYVVAHLNVAHRKFLRGGRFSIFQIYVRVAHKPKKTGGPSSEGKRVV